MGSTHGLNGPIKGAEGVVKIMYGRLLGWEVYAETVPVQEKFIDWDYSRSEIHLWVWKYHIVVNPVGGSFVGKGPNGRAATGS